MSSFWSQIMARLQDELPTQPFNTWIQPLCPEEQDGQLVLLAPNKFVAGWVKDKYLSVISGIAMELMGANASVSIGVNAKHVTMPRFTPNTAVPQRQSEIWEGSGSLDQQVSLNDAEKLATNSCAKPRTVPNGIASSGRVTNGNAEATDQVHQTHLNPDFTFESFVQGKSNQLALAAAHQVVENPGSSYNPLFIYGDVGLGKTHLMHAVGAALLERNPKAKIVYLHSERFVADMVTAFQLNAINDFKRFYRSVDALLIDDIQFFAGKERSQEELFHTFNSLLEGGQQMILTCDRYPKEIEGLEERLKSRFGWGLPVAIESPDHETRVAILQRKANTEGVKIPDRAAFFLAQRVRSNVRELEGALKRVIANARFLGRDIDEAFVQESLKDLLALQDKQVSIENIQKTVANYYKIRMADILSKRRTRSVARPRQMAMSLAKELTNHSYPEVGDAFGGRDHTTVLHACRKIKELRDLDREVDNDYTNLYRTLTV